MLPASGIAPDVQLEVVAQSVLVPPLHEVTWKAPIDAAAPLALPP